MVMRGVFVQAEEEFEVAHGVGLGTKHVSKKEVSKFDINEAGGES